MRTIMGDATRRASDRWPLLVSGVAVLVAALFLVLPAFAENAPEIIAGSEQVAQVSIVPSDVKVNSVDTFTVTVQLGDIERLYGFQYKLFFDPNVLQVVDANLGDPGVQIGRSDVFDGLGISVFENNTVSNAMGSILYGIALTEPSQGVQGPAALGQITFRAVADGVSPLRFSIGPGQSRISCLKDSGTGGPVEVPTTWNSGSVVVGDYRVMLPYTNGAGRD